ncbi:hypothetical protein [Ileibacterium valens]|uniref:SWIM-type domain-containing protein n=2 Tax=Ileibacterium valens TaxID=1862668 RepID=A0A1U7NEN4_9FIRM|nr:hypothetical protein [Ileibacterium valens]OLU38121.1 hypothetical protein BO224_09725 [Erysipelotrichaceae bacterium NYU-BL-E8]OLU38208.1 hypothetical protein BM735_09610 [Erysipelotrichaceae bacterium NYU-BL-F16]OLU38215.1 hypothetical protein BO222_08825 [Ileibacterium valens]
MDWKYSFDRRTLNLGKKIAEAGMIYDNMQQGDFYQAMVYDPRVRRSYPVQAQIDDGEVLALECGCSEANGDHLCPHEAAFLFNLEDQVSDPYEKSIVNRYSHPDFSKNKKQNPVNQSRASNLNSDRKSFLAQDNPFRKLNDEAKSESLDPQKEHSLYQSETKPDHKSIDSKNNQSNHRIPEGSLDDFLRSLFEKTKSDQSEMFDLSAKPENEHRDTIRQINDFSESGLNAFSDENQIQEEYPFENQHLFKKQETLNPVRDQSSGLKDEHAAHSQNVEDHEDHEEKEKYQKKQGGNSQKSENTGADFDQSISEDTTADFPEDFKASATESFPSMFQDESKPDLKKRIQNTQDPKDKNDVKQAVYSPATGHGLAGLIEKMPEEELREFVFSMARNDISFRQQLEMKMLKQIPEDLMETYFAQIDFLIASYQNSFGAISAHKAAEFADHFSGNLLVKLNLLQSAKLIEQMMEFYSYAIDAILSLPVMLEENQEEELWKSFSVGFDQIESEVEKDQKRELFLRLEEWIKRAQKETIISEELESLLIHNFCEEEFASRKLEYLKRRLEEETKNLNLINLSDPEITRLLNWSFTLFRNYPQLLEYKAQFLEPYENLPEVFMQRIEDACEHHEYSLAKTQIEQKLNQEQEISDTFKGELLRKLAMISRAISDPDTEVKVLKQLVLHSKDTESNDLLRLKELINEQEWMEIKEFAKDNVSPFELAKVHQTEGDLNSLMDLLEEHPIEYLAEMYEDELSADYSSRLAALWSSMAYSQAHSQESARYDHVIYCLKKVESIDQTGKAAQKNANELKKMYPRRRSLIRKLESAGF